MGEFQLCCVQDVSGEVNSTLLLSWETPLDAGDGRIRTESLVLHYFVEIATDQQFKNVVRSYGIVNSKSMAVQGLEYGVGTFCRVAAVTVEGSGVFSVRFVIPSFPNLLQTDFRFSGIKSYWSKRANFYFLQNVKQAWTKGCNKYHISHWFWNFRCNF